MAYVAPNFNNPYDPEETPGTAAPSQVLSSPVMAQGGSAPKPQKGGSQFQDVSRYLSQNKPQAQRLASRLGQNVVQQGQESRTGLNNLQNEFGQQAQQNTIGLNQNVLDQVLLQPNQQNQGNTNNNSSFVPYLSSGSGQQGQQQPINPDLLNQFSQMRDAQYQGPSGLSDLEGYQPLYDQFQDLGEYGGLTENDQGRMRALRDLYQSPQMGSGASRLDNLLLQDQGARDVLARGREQVSDLPDLFSAAGESAASQAQAAQQTTGDTAWAIQNLLRGDSEWTPEEAARMGELLQGDREQDLMNIASQGGLYGQLEGELQGRLTGEQERARSAAENIQSAIDFAVRGGADVGGGRNQFQNTPIQTTQLNLSDADYQALGITKKQLQDYLNQSFEMGLRGIKAPPLNEYLTFQDPSTLGLSSIMTDQDRARYAALSELMGGAGLPEITEGYGYDDLVDFNDENFESDLKQLRGY